MEENKKRQAPRRRRNYACTWNNYPEDWEIHFEEMYTVSKKFRYIVGGEEVGEQGTPHIQAHFDMANSITITALQKVLKKHNIRASVIEYKSQLHADNGRDYCFKDGKFKEWGEAPSQGRRNDLIDYMEDCKNNPTKKRKTLFEEFPQVMARYPRFADEYRGLTYKPPIQDWDDNDPPNIWCYGPPGVGKSSTYRELGAYPKPLNKWWPGYDYDDDVILEDFDQDHKCLGHHLKIWADRYPFWAEVKGTYQLINPKRIIVTSNYAIDEIGFAPKVAEAIKRRFTVKHMQWGPFTRK